MSIDRSRLRSYSAEAVAEAPELDWDTRTRYEAWQDEQGIPIHRDFLIENIGELETEVWALLGAHAAFVELVGAAETTGAYVLRMGAGTTTNPELHLYEQLHYVVSGEGETTSDEGGAVAWRPGTLFSTPLNTRIRHRASDDTLMYVVTTAPIVMNLFHNDAFVFSRQETFGDRVVPDEFYAKEGVMWSRRRGSAIWHTTAFDDCPTVELPVASHRGSNNRTLCIQLGENTLTSHISQFPVGSYKKCHRHGPGSHVLMLGGEGYSLLWKNDFSEHVRVDWKPNALFVPPPFWWHQHFNTGAQPARYLALRFGSAKHRLDHSHDKIALDRRDSGDQIEYEDQEPVIHKMFVEECARRGVEVDGELDRRVG